MSKELILLTSRNEKLTISAHGEENLDKAPCIICVHGFKGFKDWGFWPYTANKLVSAGFYVLTFNFSHNGIGENLTEFTETDKFAENTLSMEVDELSGLISAYKDGFFGKSPYNSIGLLGHSRGGGVSLITAYKNSGINAVAVWASVLKFDRYTDRQKEEWRKNGVFEVLNSRTNQLMRMNVSLLEDIEANKLNSLNIKKSVQNLDIPLFIAHGEQDLTVPVSEADQLFAWANKQKTVLYKIPACGHTFDAVHPFQGSNQKLDNLLDVTTNFFNTNLF